MNRAIEQRLAKLERLVDPATIRDAITLPLVIRHGENTAERIAAARAAWEREHGRAIDHRDPVLVLWVKLPAKCANMDEWQARYAPTAGTA